jgi:hypothetical protein
MIVLRSTMDAAVALERDRTRAFYAQYGDALHRVLALQEQLTAWVTGKTDGAITPEQFAQMFWANDDRWQAAFFNALQKAATDAFEARPPAKPGEYAGGYLGTPAGEPQWCWISYHLDDSGFETLESMYDHARYRRLDEGKRVGELMQPDRAA